MSKEQGKYLYDKEDVSKGVIELKSPSDSFAANKSIEIHSPKTVVIGSPTSKPRRNHNFNNGESGTQDQSGQNKPESYVLAEEPMPSVVDFFENFDKFEEKFGQSAGFLYVIIVSLLFGALVIIREEFLYRLPTIEIIFAVFIISLMLNYFLLNGALYKPFIDDEENSFKAKLCGVFGVVGIIIFYYAQKFISFHAALVLLYFGLFIIIWIEKFTSNITYNKKELLFSVVAFIGVYFITSTIYGNESGLGPEAPINASNTSLRADTLIPGTGLILQALDETTNTTESSNTTSTTAEIEESIENGSAVGYVLALAAGVCLALLLMNFHKIRKENKTTVSYIFTLFVALFLPVFFPMQGVVKPSLAEGGMLVACGLIGELTLLMLIRSLQIERSGKVGVMLFSHLVCLYLVRFLFGYGATTIGLVGCLLVVVSTLFFSREGREIMQARESFLEDEQRFRNMELKLIQN